MRRLVTVTLGMFSAVIRILFIAKDEYEPLRPAKIVVNELSWFSALMDTILVIWSQLGKPRLWFGMLMGAFGTGIGVRPFLDYRTTLDDMASAMRAGLGRGYEAAIPNAIRNRMLPAPLSFASLFGAHLRQVRARMWRDVIYVQPQGIVLQLDVYEPMRESVVWTTCPAIIMIHGGGWQNGDKQEYFEAIYRYLANNSYVVFDIQYPLSGAVVGTIRRCADGHSMGKGSCG